MLLEKLLLVTSSELTTGHWSRLRAGVSLNSGNKAGADQWHFPDSNLNSEENNKYLLKGNVGGQVEDMTKADTMLPSWRRVALTTPFCLIGAFLSHQVTCPL